MMDKTKDITAKEIVNRVFDKNQSLSPQGLEQMIKMYARKRLKEQRELCAKEAKIARHGYTSSTIDKASIKNAPEPEL